MAGFGAIQLHQFQIYWTLKHTDLLIFKFAFPITG